MHKWTILGAVTFGTVLTWIVFGPRINPPVVSHERYARLKDGMTLEEVKATLGAPPGNYQTHPARYAGFIRLGGMPCEIWSGDEGIIVVNFDDDGRAYFKNFI